MVRLGEQRCGWVGGCVCLEGLEGSVGVACWMCGIVGMAGWLLWRVLGSGYTPKGLSGV